MEQGSTFPWYELSHPPFELCRMQGRLSPSYGRVAPYHPLIYISSCSCGNPPTCRTLSPVALFFLGDAPHRASHRLIPSFIFSFGSPRGILTLVSTKSRPGFPGYREFAVHFIITLDGNKLSKRCAHACNPGVCTRYFACFCDAVHKSCEYAKSRQKYQQNNRRLKTTNTQHRKIL